MKKTNKKNVIKSNHKIKMEVKTNKKKKKSRVEAIQKLKKSSNQQIKRLVIRRTNPHARRKIK